MKIARPIAEPICRAIAQYGVSVPAGFGGGAPPDPPFDGGLIINGAFVTDTDWTKGSGWTISDDAAHNSGTTGFLSQVMESSVIDTNTYDFECDLTEAIELLVQLTGSTLQTIQSGETVGPGHFGPINFAAATANTSIRIRSSSQAFSITNIRLAPGEGV